MQLFLTLAGVTLLFTQAQLNGTLDRIAHAAVRICRGNAGLIPVMFFVLGCAIASLGPGNVSTAAMLAPMAMSVAARAAIPPFLMAIMVGNGAQSGSLSPFAPTGLIVNPLMAKIGLERPRVLDLLDNLVAHAAVAFIGYLALGGWKLFKSAVCWRHRRNRRREPIRTRALADARRRFSASSPPCCSSRANIGMAAFAGAVLLAAFRVADHEQAIRRMPWTPILMVSGVSVLIALLEKTGGLDLFTTMLAQFATAGTLTGFVAFVTGVISVYSSTSGVVLPAFLPTVPGLIARLGGDRVRRGLFDERRRPSRGHVAALHDWRRVHRRDRRSRAGAPDLQQAAGVGAFDDRGRRDRLLSVLLTATRARRSRSRGVSQPAPPRPNVPALRPTCQPFRAG